MFLNELNEDEKEVFLNMANLAIMIDDEATKNEDDLLKVQAHECDIPNFFPKFFNLDDLLSKLEKSSMLSKKVILIELMAIWEADKRWDEREITMMNKIANHFAVSEEEVLALKNWSIKMMKTHEEGMQLLSI